MKIKAVFLVNSFYYKKLFTSDYINNYLIVKYFIDAQNLIYGQFRRRNEKCVKEQHVITEFYVYKLLYISIK